MRLAKSLVHLGHGLLHPECGADGALGVVLVRHGRAEDRHHVVADVLVHPAAVALHLLAEPAQAALHEALHRLGVHRLGHSRVARQVGEHHRDLAPLLRQRERARLDNRRSGRRRFLHRRAAVHAEARLGRQLGAANAAATLERAATGHAEARTFGVLVRTARTGLARHGHRTISRGRSSVCDFCCVLRPSR